MADASVAVASISLQELCGMPARVSASADLVFTMRSLPAHRNIAHWNVSGRDGTSPDFRRERSDCLPGKCSFGVKCSARSILTEAKPALYGTGFR